MKLLLIASFTILFSNVFASEVETQTYKVNVICDNKLCYSLEDVLLQLRPNLKFDGETKVTEKHFLDLENLLPLYAPGSPIRVRRGTKTEGKLTLVSSEKNFSRTLDIEKYSEECTSIKEGLDVIFRKADMNVNVTCVDSGKAKQDGSAVESIQLDFNLN